MFSFRQFYGETSSGTKLNFCSRFKFLKVGPVVTRWGQSITAEPIGYVICRLVDFRPVIASSVELIRRQVPEMLPELIALNWPLGGRSKT
ncbi:MAG: hypothetical protein EHM61_03765 [Acidobacteria bacterium]|nr:MAG: hypothetical protein EHM61_03765 [Acidobacteriota bacterium]